MSRIDKKNRLWSDDELKAALDAYLYMLQLELSSIPFSAEQHAKLLLSGPLHERNEASVRYRMRNISHVLKERGLPILSAYSAAPQVGRHVMGRLNALLDIRDDVVQVLRKLVAQYDRNLSKSDVLQSLSTLKDRINELSELQHANIGHNNPPDSIDLSGDELSSVSEKISQLEHFVADERYEYDFFNSLIQPVLSLGLKASVWCGQRLTELGKAAAISTGTGIGLSLTGLVDQIIATIRNLIQLIL